MTLHAQQRLARATVRSSALLLTAGVLWAGCNEPPSASGVHRTAASIPGLSATDGIGRELRLSQPARRIAALSPSNVEILFAVGCGDRVVLRDRTSDYPPDAKRVPETNAFHLSAEHIAGYRPDLVLVSHLDSSRVAALAVLGIPVAVFDPQRVATVFQDIRTIGRLCGASARAEKLARRLQTRLATVEHAVAGLTRPRVYVELDGSDPLKPWTAGARSLIHNVIHLAGGENVFGDLNRSAVQVNAEAVFRRSPTVVLLAGGARASAAQLAARPAWRRMPALTKGRIIQRISPDLLSRPGPRLLGGVEALARELHPSRHAAPEHP